MAHKITLNYIDEEHLDISLDGRMVVSCNHDAHGWDGMELAKQTVTRLAKMLGIEVEVTEDVTEEDVDGDSQ